MPKRCDWVSLDDPLSLAYHDEEWGVPSHDDRHLFEMLVLEAAQAGLSWATILRKREGYRKAFSGFDPAKVARFDSRRIERLLVDPAIVRNRAKVDAWRTLGRRSLATEEHGSLDAYLWSFVGGRTIRNRWCSVREIRPRATSRSR